MTIHLHTTPTNPGIPKPPKTDLHVPSPGGDGDRGSVTLEEEDEFAQLDRDMEGLMVGAVPTSVGWIETEFAQ